MFAVFIVLQSLVISFMLAVLLWTWVQGPTPPQRRSFPLFDVAFRTEVDGGLVDLTESENKEKTKGMKDARVVTRVTCMIDEA